MRGRPLPRRFRAGPATLESYLRAGGGALPYMVRLRRIEDELARHERDVAAVRTALEAVYQVERLARVWTMVAAHWDFSAVNDLIDRHNRWYPIESRLPMDPRTGDFATRDGGSYLRRPLGPEWVLSRGP